jgi:uncharacterized protein (DUF983 family)
MDAADKQDKPVVVSEDQARGAGDGPTLLPMLVYGLILVTVGMIVLMYFV